MLMNITKKLNSNWLSLQNSFVQFLFFFNWSIFCSLSLFCSNFKFDFSALFWLSSTHLVLHFVLITSSNFFLAIEYRLAFNSSSTSFVSTFSISALQQLYNFQFSPFPLIWINAPKSSSSSSSSSSLITCHISTWQLSISFVCQFSTLILLQLSIFFTQILNQTKKIQNRRVHSDFCPFSNISNNKTDKLLPELRKKRLKQRTKKIWLSTRRTNTHKHIHTESDTRIFFYIHNLSEQKKNSFFFLLYKR